MHSHGKEERSKLFRGASRRASKRPRLVGCAAALQSVISTSNALPCLNFQFYFLKKIKKSPNLTQTQVQESYNGGFHFGRCDVLSWKSTCGLSCLTLVVVATSLRT